MSAETQSDDVTRLLREWSAGLAVAPEKLAAAVYPELKRIAVSRLRGERAGHTLQPTALVNETFLKLLDQRQLNWQNRNHFFAIAARLMRRILVDYARMRHAEKRRAAELAVTLDDAVERELSAAATDSFDILRLDEALSELANIHRRQAQVVELRFFVGFTIVEVAQALEVSPATVKTDWQVAKAWLHHRLESQET